MLKDFNVSEDYFSNTTNIEKNGVATPYKTLLTNWHTLIFLGVLSSLTSQRQNWGCSVQKCREVTPTSERYTRVFIHGMREQEFHDLLKHFSSIHERALSPLHRQEQWVKPTHAVAHVQIKLLPQLLYWVWLAWSLLSSLCPCVAVVWICG